MDDDLIARSKASYDAFNRGDNEGALRFMHPEIEWRTYLVPGPGGGTYRGHDGVVQLWSDVRNVFDDFRNEAEEFFANGDRVVVFVRFSGRGRESGADVEARLAHLFEFESGLLRRVRTYQDREQALAAAGIGSGTSS
jgi:ketosteroid isomerase-like protein